MKDYTFTQTLEVLTV